jgi:hypothetical protein
VIEISAVALLVEVGAAEMVASGEVQIRVHSGDISLVSARRGACGDVLGPIAHPTAQQFEPAPSDFLPSRG